MKNQSEITKEISQDDRKVAIVTGSSSGIGYATALELARNGYLTYATMRNPAKGADLIKTAKDENLPIKIEQLDVTDLDSIRGFMTKISRIDVLVNNAGVHFDRIT